MTNYRPKITFHNDGRGGGNTAHALKTLITQPKNERGVLVVPSHGQVRRVLEHPIIEELNCTSRNQAIQTPSGAQISLLNGNVLHNGWQPDLIVIDEFDNFINPYELKQWALSENPIEIILTGQSTNWNTCQPPYEPTPFSYKRFSTWKCSLNRYKNRVTLYNPNDNCEQLDVSREYIQIASANNSCSTSIYQYKAKSKIYEISEDIKSFTQDDLAALWHYAHFQRNTKIKTEPLIKGPNTGYQFNKVIPHTLKITDGESGNLHIQFVEEE